MSDKSAKLKVSLIKSPIRRKENQAQVLHGLGLHRLHQSKVLEDTPSIRGMVRKVQHLLNVEEIK